MSLTIYMVRHGETTASLTGGYCGSLDLDLTPEGIDMAEDFAAAYQKIDWTTIYVSPLRRAVATAKPLCEKVNMKMELRDGLREIAYGEWEGKTPEEVDREYHDDYVRWLKDPAWNSPTGGERGIDIAWRSFAVIKEIEQKYSRGNILLVSHKATIRVILCFLLGIELGRFRDRIGMPVASVSIVEFGPQGPLLRGLGDRSHLRESLRHRVGT